ncbi:MAG TPA: MtrB/PioB family outer membrane beta-barrel protein [Vicinamibacterales bacterium]|nr:MtrB/PioB family outer membrane beta-barrel protein [Vicinamibacterales bacterium]
MRDLIRLVLIGSIAVAAPLTARAQQTQPPEPTSPPTAAEDTRSLFDQTWHQLQVGGRFSGIDGDPARFQRYQDMRDGVLFTNFRYGTDDPRGLWYFHATADNVGYHDQRYSAVYQRTGRLVISGLFDQIPQFYSVDTKTPYGGSASNLLLDDATQLKIQQGQANLNAWVPLAPQFDLTERRDVGTFRVVATPKPALDVSASFTTTRHTGELPWGASFGFGNDVEIPLPYDSRTNDFTVATEWTNMKEMLRVQYNGSWFNNLADTVTWDSPLRLNDSTSAPGRGRTALWPTNSAQTISASGYGKFAHRTQITGSISYGFWNQDQPLLPFTINPTLPQLTLPRTSAQAEAHVFSGNISLVTRPRDNFSFTARLRDYVYDNQTPHTAIPQFINYDTSVATSSTGGPEPYAHHRQTFDADATWTGHGPFALTAGYTRNDLGWDFRIFESSAENVLRLQADAVGATWGTFRAKYEYGSRRGSGLDEELLVEIGEQPDMRHFDLADRNRNLFNGQVDIVPNDLWTFSVSAGVTADEYPDSYFGLQNWNGRTVSLGADYHLPNGFGGGGTYNYERYTGLQRSRSASPGSTPPQETDPKRDWTTDTAETVNYFSLYVTPPRFGPDTEVRVSYDFSYAEGSYLYTIVPGGPLAAPSQLPAVYNKLQQLHVDVRHRLTHNVAIVGTYLYEPFTVYDFALDPSVVNGIVQPSSLVMGYVYRPYTANSGTISLRYLW